MKLLSLPAARECRLGTLQHLSYVGFAIPSVTHTSILSTNEVTVTGTEATGTVTADQIGS